MKTFVRVCLLVCLAASAAAQSRDYVNDLKGKELVMRPVVEAHRKLYLPSGSNLADPFVLYEGDRLFPLRASEPVVVTDVNVKDSHVELKVKSKRLGSGRVKFYGRAADKATFHRWLDEVFVMTTPENVFDRYVGNSESGTVHLRGANHLPDAAHRASFHTLEDARASGFRTCGVCFQPRPDVSDYETESWLALLGLQEVRSAYFPLVDAEAERRLSRVGNEVLSGWPVPLKGYRYRFQVLDTEDINAFAVPTGYLFVTRGLMDSIEGDAELAAVLAHEITHVENRHTYREWRNAEKASWILGGIAVAEGGEDGDEESVVSEMALFVAQMFLSGFGRDREREADAFASLYLSNELGDVAPLEAIMRKLKFAQDLYDPLGEHGGGLFASHPHIDERVLRARATRTERFTGTSVFEGFSSDGDTVAWIRLDLQRLYGSELEVIATLTTTAELGSKDNVNTLTLEFGKHRLELKELTAESIYPSDQVSALFGKDDAAGFVRIPITGIGLKLRNVESWRPAEGL